jgi:hypothetical protein
MEKKMHKGKEKEKEKITIVSLNLRVLYIHAIRALYLGPYYGIKEYFC